MILNLSKIKTEALLLFCRDLINSYRNKDNEFFNIDKEMDKYINEISEEMLKEMKRVTSSDEYYMRNKNNFRIRAILNAYELINKEISKELKEGNPFNPAMLYFSLLAVWFKEFDKESRSKEYIYFLIYPYGNVYDKLLLNIKDDKFKFLNIKMIEISERIILKLDRYSFK